MGTQDHPEETRAGRRPRAISGATPAIAGAGGGLDLPVHIGAFRILERLGEGGMGVVYLAEQQVPVTRRVALKVMRNVVQQGGEAEFRFAAERQAMARLSHPCVARLFEAGTTGEGHPFFAMEFVEGTSLTAFCDGERMGLEARLEVFRAVCEGVQHAHQKGLLHRDLKPSNILVAREGDRIVPKIIDFGIATTLDDPEPGLVAGTPAYMSPEAFDQERDLDTRSDVYSLGVVLHELLAGVRPVEAGSSLTQVRRAEAEAPSPRLSLSGQWTHLDPRTKADVAAARGMAPEALGRRLRGDLDWILAKALASDREARYGSPAELAADLARLASGEPVLARPSTPLYRLTCTVRRNRGAVASGVLLVAALGGGVWARTREAQRATREARRASAQAEIARSEARRADGEWRRAEGEAERARAEASEADRQRLRAENQTRLAVKAQRVARLETKTAQEVSDFLQGLFKVSTPSEALGSTITAKEVLDKGAARIEKDLAGQPLVQTRLMQAMGGAYVEMGLYKQAEPLLERALKQVQEGKLPDRDLEGRLLNDLGALAFYRYDYPTSERRYREALAVKRALPKRDAKDLSRALTSLANPLIRQNRLEEAERLLQEARQGLSGSTEDLKLQSSVLASLGGVYHYQKKPSAALAAFQEGLKLRRRASGERHPELIPFLNNLDQTARALGQWEQAEAYRKETLDLSLAFLGPKHPGTAQAYFELAKLAERKQDWASVEEACRKAFEIRQEALGPGKLDTLRCQQGAGHALLMLGRSGEAEAVLRSSVQTLRKEQHQGQPEYRRALLDLAKALQALGRAPEAQAVYEELLPLQRSHGKTEISNFLGCLRGLYQVCLEQKAYGPAEAAIREAVAVMAAQKVTDDPALALGRGLLGDVLTTLGRYGEAEASLQAGLAVLAKVQGERDGGTQRVLQALVRLYETWGRPDAAAAYRTRIQRMK